MSRLCAAGEEVAITLLTECRCLPKKARIWVISVLEHR